MKIKKIIMICGLISCIIAFFIIIFSVGKGESINYKFAEKESEKILNTSSNVLIEETIEGYDGKYFNQTGFIRYPLYRINMSSGEKTLIGYTQGGESKFFVGNELKSVEQIKREQILHTQKEQAKLECINICTKKYLN